VVGATYNSLLRDTAVALSAAGIDNVRFEARLLLGRASGLSIEQMVSRGQDEALPAVAAELRVLTARRVRREPMAYILGEREFWGLPFKVSPAVLVPRPDSETMIDAAIGLLPDRARPLRILDLGLGSGCLLLTLLHEFPQASGVGIEVSPEALAIARQNAAALGMAPRATLLEGDWHLPDWARNLGGPFDLVVSNPPYIEAGDISGLMPEVARFEPALALDGGGDGLAAYRAIATSLSGLLAPGGTLLFEVGASQATAVAGLLEVAGLTPAPPWKDLGGVERVVPARQ
jgi:release factor glutamine methyltransferase